MPDEPSRMQLTPLFNNAVLRRLERLRIHSIRRFTNKHRGEHLSGRGGRSNEFADYRDYVPDDDVRFVDWNIFARLNRPYLKLFHLEEEMHLAILVDASSSMGFEGKLELAKRLAGAFGVMGLMGSERVSVHAFNVLGTSPRRLRPCTGRANMDTVLRFVQGIEAGGDTPTEVAVDEFLRVHVGRGLVVLLSDFFTFGDMKRVFNALFGSGLEIMAIQILGPTEIDPEVTGDIRFVDCETRDTLDISPAELADIYQEYREQFERNLALLCQRRSGRFITLSSEDPLERVLFDRLIRRGWIQ